jgi:hypothetical protein
MSGPRLRHRLSRRHLPTVALAIALAADLAAVVLIVATDQASRRVPLDVFSVGGLVLAATFGTVGWVIASRRPDNAIGWVFLAIGLSQAGSVFSGAYAYYGLIVAPASLPLAAEMSWVQVWSWAPGFTLLATLAVLLFPDGRLPSARWRPVRWASFGVMALLCVPTAVASWPYRGPVLLGEGPPPDDLAMIAVALQGIGIIILPFLAFASITGMVVRFRRSGPTERQQLKWFTFAAVPEIAFLIASGFITVPQLVGVVAGVLIAPLLPLAAGVAILRYHLYEIDRLISRTIAYALVTGVLIAAYGALILLLQGPLGQITGGDTVSVVLSTLAVFALFQPVLRRVQRVVDRRFDRGRYDADRTAAAFSERLRDEMDLANLSQDLDSTVRSAIAPRSLGIWLRPDRSR